MDKVSIVIGAIILVVFGLIGLSLLLSLPLMLAWNYVMPDVFQAPHLTWLQAWSLSIVAASLVKSSTINAGGK